MKNWPFGVGHCGCPTPIARAEDRLAVLDQRDLEGLGVDPQPRVDRLQVAQRASPAPSRSSRSGGSAAARAASPSSRRRAVEDQHEVVGPLRGTCLVSLATLRADFFAARARSPPSRRRRSTTSCPAGSRARSSPRGPAPRPRARPRPRVPTVLLNTSSSARHPRHALGDDLPGRPDRQPLDVRALRDRDRRRAGLRRLDLEGRDALGVGLRRQDLLRRGA